MPSVIGYLHHLYRDGLFSPEINTIEINTHTTLLPSETKPKKDHYPNTIPTSFKYCK